MSLVRSREALALPFDVQKLEQIILHLAERYEIRLPEDVLPQEALPNAGLTAGLALAGGLLGLYFGGKVGALAGAVGGAGAAVAISFHQNWERIKHKLAELYYIVYNFLTSLGISDYVAVGTLIYGSIKNREQLVRNMIEFISMKLGKVVLSNLANRSIQCS